MRQQHETPKQKRNNAQGAQNEKKGDEKDRGRYAAHGAQGKTQAKNKDPEKNPPEPKAKIPHASNKNSTAQTNLTEDDYATHEKIKRIAATHSKTKRHRHTENPRAGQPATGREIH
ncbi:hypothetical protein BDV93DRAFT_512313 [Ceratobasidium sp. AG-I]|nr:hypothetical protein BDV93DRAFT_512313 [Ceratobasidium sp. AG-I]